MSEMPERIWAHLRSLLEDQKPENNTWNTFARGTKYVRDDLVKAELAKKDAEIELAYKIADQATRLGAFSIEPGTLCQNIECEGGRIAVHKMPELATHLKEKRNGIADLIAEDRGGWA